MTVLFEIRIPGDRGTPEQLQRLLDRQIGRLGRRATLNRVEVRYSRRAATPFQRELVQRALWKVVEQRLRGRKLPGGLSIHPHQRPGSLDGALEDASGEHLIRGMGDIADAWWQRLLKRLREAWARRRDVDPAAREEPSLPPVIAQAEAVQLLRDAVRRGARQPEAATGIPPGRGSVTRALVVVRLPALHEVLGSLVPRDRGGVGEMVKSAGLALSDDFAVDYRYEPEPEGEGTSVAGASDLEVRLKMGTAASAAEPAPAPAMGAPAGCGTALPQSAASVGTALPRPTDGVRVRLLGTLERAFERPFELRLPALPARLDRTVLERAGFGQAHGPLLAVASNRSPIEFLPGTNGRPCVRFNPPVGEGGALPMYRHGVTLEVLQGEMDIAEVPPTIVLNDPAGVVDPASGSLLPALRLQVMAA